MQDFLGQIWLAITRRLLTYFIAVLSLGLGVAAFLCLNALKESYVSNLAHRVTYESDFSINDGPVIGMSIGFAPHYNKGGRFNVEWINGQVQGAMGKNIGAMASGKFDVKADRYALQDLEVFALSGDWLKIHPHFLFINSLLSGRLFSPADDTSKEAVCIINQALLQAFPPDTDPVGQIIKVGGRPFHIVGVVSNLRGPLVLISLSAAYPLFQIQPPWSMDFLVKSDEIAIESEMTSVKNTVSQALGRDYDVRVSSDWVNLEGLRYQITYTRLFLGILSLLPLVVGLLGLVSMLLANLNNRVREIGLYRALGATRLRQAVLVLGEAGFTGLLASLVGIPIGILVLHLLASAWGSELRSTPGLMAAAVAAGTLTSMLAGLIPARAAMRISPCEALRAE